MRCAGSGCLGGWPTPVSSRMAGPSRQSRRKKRAEPVEESPASDAAAPAAPAAQAATDAVEMDNAVVVVTEDLSERVSTSQDEASESPQKRASREVCLLLRILRARCPKFRRPARR